MDNDKLFQMSDMNSRGNMQKIYVHHNRMDIRKTFFSQIELFQNEINYRMKSYQHQIKTISKWNSSPTLKDKYGTVR